jgi:hypothetical protein
MTRVAGEFKAALPPDEAIVACAAAVERLGWRVEDVAAGRIASGAKTASGHPFRVEIELADLGGATGIRVTGSDLGAAPLEQEVLIAELNRLRAAIEAGAAPAADRPPPARASAGRGGRRLAMAGIIALVAIGVVVAAIAILGGSSDDSTPKVRHKGAKSKTSGKPKASPGKSAPHKKPQAQSGSGSSELGQSKEIHDADLRFTLTPTSVQREGSYITVKVELTGVGSTGYEPTGNGFQATLIGSDGQAYQVNTSGAPDGCDPPDEKLDDGQTGDGCVPFKVPEGVNAATFRYVPFFVGSRPVQWRLRG